MTLPEQKKQALLEEYNQKFGVGSGHIMHSETYQGFFDFLLEKVAEAKQETLIGVWRNLNRIHSNNLLDEHGAFNPETLAEDVIDYKREIKAQVSQGKDELHTEKKPFDSEKFMRLAEEIREGEMKLNRTEIIALTLSPVVGHLMVRNDVPGIVIALISLLLMAIFTRTKDA